jgi:hypothetical protein
MSNFKDRTLLKDPEAPYQYEPYIRRVRIYPKINGWEDMRNYPRVEFYQEGLTLGLVMRILLSSERHLPGLVKKVNGIMLTSCLAMHELLTKGGVVVKGGMPFVNGSDGMDIFTALDEQRLFPKVPFNYSRDIHSLEREFPDNILRDALGLPESAGRQTKPLLIQPGALDSLYTVENSGEVILKAQGENQFNYFEQAKLGPLYEILGHRLQNRLPPLSPLPPIVDTWGITETCLSDLAARIPGHVLPEPGPDPIYSISWLK